MCELTRHCMDGNGMGKAWHGMGKAWHGMGAAWHV
jgi:hypothetical protein